MSQKKEKTRLDESDEDNRVPRGTAKKLNEESHVPSGPNKMTKTGIKKKKKAKGQKSW